MAFFTTFFCRVSGSALIDAIITGDVLTLSDAEFSSIAPDLVKFQDDIAALSPTEVDNLRELSIAYPNASFPHLEMIDIQSGPILPIGGGGSKFREWFNRNLPSICVSKGDMCGPNCLPRYHPACHCCAGKSRLGRHPWGCLKIKCCPCMDQKMQEYFDGVNGPCGRPNCKDIFGKPQPKPKIEEPKPKPVFPTPPPPAPTRACLQWVHGSLGEDFCYRYEGEW